VLISDNLTTHVSLEILTALLAWPGMQLVLLPQYACWLNLNEPLWKQLRGLALKGAAVRKHY
jgi:transposase